MSERRLKNTKALALFDRGRQNTSIPNFSLKMEGNHRSERVKYGNTVHCHFSVLFSSHPMSKRQQNPHLENAPSLDAQGVLVDADDHFVLKDAPGSAADCAKVV